MPNTIKKIAFLAPRADLEDWAFRDYWEGTHGPLVGSSPGYAAWRWRYVQNHPLGPGPEGGTFAFAGIAEFWLPPHAPTEEEYAVTPVYRDRIAPDEDRFIDKSGTLSLRAREQILVRGRGPAKLIRFGRWSGDTTPRMLTDLLAQMEEGGLARSLLDWRVDHVEPGSTRLPGGGKTSSTALDVDYMETLRFASEAEGRAHVAATAGPRAEVFDGPATTLFVREHVFFADGAFVG